MCSPVEDTWTMFSVPAFIITPVPSTPCRCINPSLLPSSSQTLQSPLHIVTIHTVFVVHFMSLFAFSWYHRDAENTGNMRTNFPCGLLSVGSGAWTNPCVSNTTIRGERHYPVENNNPGIGCSVHCTFSSLEVHCNTFSQQLVFLR